jgi:hypothetical protein
MWNLHLKLNYVMRVTQAATLKQFNLLACVSQVPSTIKKKDILVLLSHAPTKKKWNW